MDTSVINHKRYLKFLSGWIENFYAPGKGPGGH